MKRRSVLGIIGSTMIAPTMSRNATAGSLLSDAQKHLVIPNQSSVGLTTNLYPGVNTVFDARGQIYRFLANNQGTKYPLVLRNVPTGVGLVGARIVGDQPRGLTWREMKISSNKRDGDGIGHQYILGSMAIEDIRIENVMDGVSFPTKSYSSASWQLRYSYMSYIRDDAIENDFCAEGLIEDCLIDGCFIFYSERPGQNAAGHCQSPPKVTTMQGVLVKLEPMPWDGDLGGSMGPPESYQPDNMGHGQLFKMGSNTGRVDCTDCVFVYTRVSINHRSTMLWPPGTYTRCKLVWLGGGSWPGQPLPTGVTLTTSNQAWLDVRSDWLNRHGG